MVAGLKKQRYVSPYQAEQYKDMKIIFLILKF